MTHRPRAGSVLVMTTYGLTAEAVATLQQVLDFLTEHPEQHEQQTWLKKVPTLESSDLAACGTVGCLAGHLSLIGHTIPDSAWEPFYTYARDGDQLRYWVIRFDQFPVTTAAEEALGLSYVQNPDAVEARGLLDRMFEGDRTIRQLWELGNELTDGRLRIPENLPEDPNEPCSCHLCV